MKQKLYLLAIAGLLAGCGDNLDPAPRGQLADGTYQVTWNAATAGLSSCESVVLTDGALLWPGTECQEAWITGESSGGCAEYTGEGYVWRICPDGAVHITGERLQDGRTAASFSAELTVPYREACLEQAEAWCEYLDRCNGEYPSCVSNRTLLCLAEIPEAPPVSEQEACLETLETADCQGAAYWPEQCAATRQD